MADTPAAQKFQLIPIDEIEPPAGSADVVKGLLPRTGLAVLYGPPGCGKSFLALDVGIHIALGRTWAGRRVAPCGVVYVAAEAGEGFKRRAAAARDRLGAYGAEFALITAAPNLGAGPGEVADLVGAIRAQSLRLGWRAGVVILDTLARVIPGVDENSSREMGRFVANAEAIARDLRGLVIAVHHQGKNADAGMRGSSALHGAADVEWAISVDGGVRSAKLVKSKEGVSDLSWTFELEAVEVGTDDDGEPVTTCVISNVSAPAFGGAQRTARAAIPASQKLLIACLDNAFAEAPEEIRPYGIGGPGIRAVRRDTVRDEFIRSHAADDREARKRAFNRALGAASASKLILSADLGGANFIWRA